MAATPEAVGAGQRRARLRAALASPPLTEGRKKCVVCGEWKRWKYKDISSEFTVSAHQRKSGYTSYAPYPRCKKCHAAKVKARRDLNREDYRAARREWYKDYRARKEEELREYWREYATDRRRQAGIGPRPFKRRKEEPCVRVPVGPMLGWMDEWLAATGTSETELLRKAFPGDEGAQRMVYRWRHEAQQQAELKNLDALATAMGMPDQIACLYYEELDERQVA